MSEQKKPDAAQPQAQANTPQPAEGETPLSAAELKKRAKAEKQARRAAVTAQKEATAHAQGGAASGSANGEAKGPKPGPSHQQKAKPPPPPQKGQQKQHERRPSGVQSGSLPVRARGGSQSGPKEAEKQSEKKKTVELFSHLSQQPRRQNIDGVSKDVHPSVVALGFKITSYEICGSTARCVGMLNAFKDVVQEYTTPAGTSLSRNMTSHHLGPQIEFLKSCRPLSESMGNAIRHLKKLIVEVDPSMPEHEAKQYLCNSIDKFIQERIAATDQVIVTFVAPLIEDGSVVLTYAKSSIVEKTILRAKADGKDFRVICVDSRPLFEGKKLAATLVQAGLDVEYVCLRALARAVADATVVLLGAHSMLSNGRLQSRVGTSSVAMKAHGAGIPVVVCCESVKFTEKVALDSIVLNEVAPPEELLPPAPLKAAATPAAPSMGKGSKDDEAAAPTVKTLHDYEDIPNLQILNLMYDVTPAEYISMVVCEYGKVPPGAVPGVHRQANEVEG